MSCDRYKRLRQWRKLPVWIGAALLLFATLPLSADQLYLRLLRASHAEGPVPPVLRDVLPTLRNSLVFKSYELMDQARQPLPLTGEAEVSLGGYGVRCNGPVTQMSIKITRNGRGLIDTVASLRRGQPLILGGFGGGGGGQVIFVLTLQ